MGDLSDFQKGQIIGALLAGASITKTRTLLGVSVAAVFNVMTAYTNHGKISPATRTSGRKPKLTERDRRTLKRIVSKNDRTTAAKVHQYSIFILRTQFDESFTNPTSTVGLQVLNL